MRKKIFNLIFMCLFLVFLFAIIGKGFVTKASSNQLYKVYNINGTYDIKLSDKQLKDAYSNLRLIDDISTIENRINNIGDVHVYRFKANVWSNAQYNYYNIYTTAKKVSENKYIGLRDTYITLYRTYEKKIWFSWNRVYEPVMSDDDGCMVGGSTLGASLIINRVYDEKNVKSIFRNLEYIICVRGYGTKTGNYTLYTEHNYSRVDRTLFDVNRWMWTDEMINYAPGVYLKQYFNELECILLYKALSPLPFSSNKKMRNIKDLYSIYNEDEILARQIATGIASEVITGISEAIMGVCCPPVGVILSLSNSLFSVTGCGLDAIFEELFGKDTQTYSDNDKKYRLQEIIVELCGLCPDDVSEKFYKSGNTYTWSPSIRISNGMVYICKKGFTDGKRNWKATEKYYEAYSSNILLGGEGEIGIWI